MVHKDIVLKVGVLRSEDGRQRKLREAYSKSYLSKGIVNNYILLYTLYRYIYTRRANTRNSII